jgi:hypothetical protein
MACCKLLFLSSPKSDIYRFKNAASLGNKVAKKHVKTRLMKIVIVFPGHAYLERQGPECDNAAAWPFSSSLTKAFVLPPPIAGVH